MPFSRTFSIFNNILQRPSRPDWMPTISGADSVYDPDIGIRFRLYKSEHILNSRIQGPFWLQIVPLGYPLESCTNNI